MGFWGWFYFLAVSATLIRSLLPVMPLRLRQHTFGAEIIAASWLASFIAREALNDATPLVAYSIIDAATAAVFLYVALRNQALWAALCVMLHAAMGALHVAFFLTGEANTTGYLWILNILFLLALLVINFAMTAGRRKWGEGLDEVFRNRLRGWSFSGVRRHGVSPGYQETVD